MENSELLLRVCALLTGEYNAFRRMPRGYFWRVMRQLRRMLRHRHLRIHMEDSYMTRGWESMRLDPTVSTQLISWLERARNNIRTRRQVRIGIFIAQAWERSNEVSCSQRRPMSPTLDKDIDMAFCTTPPDARTALPRRRASRLQKQSCSKPHRFKRAVRRPTVSVPFQVVPGLVHRRRDERHDLENYD